MKKFLVGLPVILVAVALGFYLYTNSGSQTILIDNDSPVEKVDEGPVSITKEEIREENYSGSRPVITGDNALALAARNHVEAVVSEFEAQANTDVPPMREKFGPDHPTATYTIEIEAKQLESPTTRSIVLSEYVYTGGAHGLSSYKVITASKAAGRILHLGDLIARDKQTAFTALVKQKLFAWRPDNAGGVQVVFPEEVDGLTFDSFANWALDDQNLILFFGQYEVGPGALGAFPFPIPLDDLKGLLK